MTFKDLRQTKNYAEYMAAVGWLVDKVDDVFIYTKHIPLLVGVMKIQRPEKIVKVEKLIELANHHKIKTLFIEASSDRMSQHYQANSFSLWHESLLPSKTVRLDLVNTPEFLLKTMHYKARYNIKKGLSNKLSIIRSDDIVTFAEFWQKTSLGWGMFLPHKKYIVKLHQAFGDESRVYIAKANEEIVAGLQIVATKNIAYYMYAASNSIGKKLFAPTHLAWRAVGDARKSGKRYFDFEGIYDDRMPLPAWRGFTKFKLSFGGRVVVYPQPLRKTL